MTNEQKKQKLEAVAHEAAQAYFTNKLNGIDRGCCGFAWVTIYPRHKGNTRLGKEERKVLEGLGASKDYTGKTWMIWNPARLHVQNVDVLAAGAVAAAEYLKEQGIHAVAQSRLD